MTRLVLPFALLLGCGHGGHAGPDAGGPGNGDGSGAGNGDSSTGGGDGSTGGDAGVGSLVCAAHHWQPIVSASGPSMMAFRGKTYVFSQSGAAWTVIDNGGATTSEIPLPAGITAMQLVTAEIGLDGLPVLRFNNNNAWYAVRFDGTAFSAPVQIATNIGLAGAHADGHGNIYAVGGTGLVEYPPGGPPIVRGALPETEPVNWTVGADGTVYVLREVTRPSTIHPGDNAYDLRMLKLPHGSLTWSADALVTSNEVTDYYGTAFAAAPDGSLHIAYEPGEGMYLRSMDGVTWDTEIAFDLLSKATLVDYAPDNEEIDPPDEPEDVDGYIAVLAAQDYDHVSITLTLNNSSLYTSSYYFLRRCPPFVGQGMTWPAERLAFSEAMQGEVAIDEHGLASIMTPTGVHVDVSP